MFRQTLYQILICEAGLTSKKNGHWTDAVQTMIFNCYLFWDKTINTIYINTLNVVRDEMLITNNKFCSHIYWKLQSKIL